MYTALMIGEAHQYTIQQVALITGLSVHTLRYYERIGLLPEVERAMSGHRRYSEQDIDRIKFICYLLKTRMPLDQIKHYTMLYLQGEVSRDERAAILSAHREEVMLQIDELYKTLAAIDSKLANHCESKALSTKHSE